MKKFTEEQIRRTDLPHDVFGLIHDLCYHVNNNLRGSLDEKAADNYVCRAQEVLRRKSPESTLSGLLNSIEEMKPHITNPNHIPWNNVLHWASKLSKKSHRKT